MLEVDRSGELSQRGWNRAPLEPARTEHNSNTAEDVIFHLISSSIEQIDLWVARELFLVCYKFVLDPGDPTMTHLARTGCTESDHRSDSH